MAREGRARREAQPVDHRGRQIAQADGSGHGPAGRCIRREDHQRDGRLIEVEGGTVAEDPVIAERFAVIRRDDDQRIVE